MKIPLLVVVVSLGLCSFASKYDTKAKMEAIFIYNFTKYVSWPLDKQQEVFTIGVFGENDKLRVELDKFTETRKVNMMPIKVVQLKDEHDIENINLLYVASNVGEIKLKDILRYVDNDPVLVVTEGYGYGKSMINFVTVNDRQRFELNRERCTRAGLMIDEKLIQLSIATREEWNSILDKLSDLIDTDKESVVIQTSELSSLLEDHKELGQVIEESKSALKILEASAIDKKEKLALQEDILREKYEEVNRIEQQISVLDESLIEQKKHIESQGEEIESQQFVIYLVGGILGVTVILIVFVVRSNLQRKKTNRIIQFQKEQAEEQRVSIEKQKQHAELKNKEITDSINYARRIQSAILPPTKLVKEYLQESFILYKPKDIVAGDFYWMETVGDSVFYAAADCTGHGVPGAMVSVMCSNSLSKAVKELGKQTPAEILDATVKLIEARFEKSEEDVKDGMDLALVKLDIKNRRLEYSGANNPLWIVRGVEVLETRADKQPIGSYDYRKPYTNHQIDLQKGDAIYTFSDGYVDQFGGEKGKKFKSKPFKKLLVSIQDKSMEEQRDLINKAFEDWRGKNEQVDDVCVIGVRV